ncbi:MAG: hypothetical protein ACOYMN_05690, partial [Roseimicrobium sp.]
FGQQLHALRTTRQLTTVQAAAVFGASVRTYQGWEAGRLDNSAHFHAPLLEYFERHAPAPATSSRPQARGKKPK